MMLIAMVLAQGKLDDMECKVKIRPESQEDYQAIEEITRAAFKDHPYSRQTEHLIIRSLREQGDLAISLVAEEKGKVAGHIAFSKVIIGERDQSWYGMGPVSVAPLYQRQGIGSKLVRAGLQALRQIKGKGCVLVGDPLFYDRFGFKAESCLTFEHAPKENFMALCLQGELPRGEVLFHQAFAVSS
ncbi:GNAT family N-acetyltransferase [Dethiosulfatarculus sandiegensis]|uniref:GNAT family N-acetyltransferase n=1 Tax=Dethiosulfatarculus sandiegensis TaxID=1429043 RepID=UPI0018D04D35|nr:N-acetyltransferase [Dethiosulfatarculus sandiegensis]